MKTNTEKFKKHLDALAGIYYRLDKGTSGGRNSRSTEDTLTWHFKACRALLEAEMHDEDSPLYAELDAKPKLAAKWDRIERRYYGLPS